MKSYKKLGVLKFGRQLVESGDLDPIYIALWNVKIPRERLKRLLFAYWMFYHLGVASKLSQYKGRKFYEMAETLVRKTSTPRGTERRHFRSKAAIEALRFFRTKKPEVWIDEVCQYKTVGEVINHLDAHWPQFGPWIAFKAADMVERLGLKKIKFEPSLLKMYREPKRAALMLIEKPETIWSGFSITEVVTGIAEKLIDLKAPPRYERLLNAQEVETILCKWKSHQGGHYPIGKDTKEIIHHCKGWGKLARRYRNYLIRMRNV